MSQRSEDFDVTALESALRELRPSSEPLDRAVLMYRAGRASARGWIWPATVLFSSALALALGIALWIRPAPTLVYVAVPAPRNDEVSVSPPAPSRADDPERGAWSRYVHLQEQVLLYGLDGLPALPSDTGEQPSSIETLLNSL
jgi:hypothetical protein